MSALNARRGVHKQTLASAADRKCLMTVAGTVEKIVRRKTDKGNTILMVDVLTDNDYRSRLRYIQVRQPIPLKGQRVSITGVPLELKGRFPTNIGAVQVRVEDPISVTIN